MRFLFFDEILECEPGRRALGKKTFSFDGHYFNRHFTRRPIVPATLVMEAVAQVAGWLNFVTHDRRIRTVVALAEEARLRRQIRVGETVHLAAEFVYLHPGGATMRGEAIIDGEVVGDVKRLVFANQDVGEEGFSAAELEHFDYLVSGSDPKKVQG